MQYGAVAVLSLAVGEALLRFYTWCRGWTPNCYAAELQLFRPHATVGHDLAPGFCLQSGVFRISTNSVGLRGPEIARVKPPGTKRIAILGESSAFGYLVSDGQEAARLLEANLRQEGHAVEVQNAGVPGYNLYQAIVRFREVVAPLQPDIVVSYLGWNDLPYVASGEPAASRFQVRAVAPAWQRWASHSTLYGFLVYRVWGGPARLAPADFSSTRPTAAGSRQFEENLGRLADEVASAGARLVVCAQASAAHRRVSGGLRPALSSDPAAREATIRLGGWLRDALARFAAERELVFIDAYSQIPPNEEMLADYIHLTAAGEHRLAELLAAELLPLLENPDRPVVPGL